MKKIVITDYTEFGDIPEKKTLVVMGEENMEAQDGYHTFGELYEHRIVLFIAYCKLLCSDRSRGQHPVWKSKIHADGSSFDGWFVLGIDTDKGNQITYHLPIDRWNECEWEGIQVFDKAPEWDGHTPADVLERLKKL